jgi:hypothetical protein
MQTRGVPAEPVERRRGKLSERIEADREPASDLTGIDGWAVVVRADHREHWSAHLDAAERAAKIDGAKHAAIVEFRRGADVGGSYVAMTLDTWCEVLKELA